MELNVSNNPTAPGRKCLRQEVTFHTGSLSWPVLLGSPVLVRGAAAVPAALSSPF